MPFSNPPFVHRLAEVVVGDPLAPAIEELGGPRLCYGQLWGAAVALSETLRSHLPELDALGPQRAGPGLPVLCLEVPRGASWVVGMLGAWMGGFAYCPLPKSTAKLRREALMERVGARVCLVASGDESGPQKAGMLQIPIELSTPWRDLLPADESLTESGRESLAYVIFTSGSTGRPKGVKVLHRGIVPMLEAQIQAFEIDASARCLWALSPSFDASLSDVGTALLGGATLIVDPSKQLGRADTLLARLGAAEITHADLPPSLLPHLDPKLAPPSLRTLIVGGEPVAFEAARVWSERLRLVSVYGPTEATVCTSIAICDPQWDRALLGTPIAGVEHRVQEGELLIVGDCVADGYLDDAALSAERFVSYEGRPAYRTGDCVSVDRDGLQVFAGRKDRQLKVGGCLVAPEEIETVLARLPGVEAVAIVEAPHSSGLWAFVEGTEGVQDDAILGAVALLEGMRRSLPAHLLPQKVHRVSGLPRTASGKVDREALLKLAKANAPMKRQALGGLEAADALEVAEDMRLLWALVSEALGLDLAQMSADASFPQLGGSSLSALRVAARAEALGLGITARALLESSNLAAVLTEARLEEASLDCGFGVSVAALRARVHRLLQEEGLSDPIAATEREAPSGPGIFLTGATGMLGAHTLRILLDTEEGGLTCLVRARDGESAKRRLRSALFREGLGTEGLERVHCVVGDLALPKMGLGDDMWSELARTTTGVLHLAGLVHGAKGEKAMFGANVRGTLEALKFAITARANFTFASTLSIFVGTDAGRGSFAPEDFPPDDARVRGRYDASKIMAEMLVTALSPRLSRVSVMRYGLLQGLGGQGWLDRIVRGLSCIGGFPADRNSELAFDLTPVEHAAERTVRASRSSFWRSPLGIYHVAGSRTLKVAALYSAFEREGVELSILERSAFVSLAAEKIAAGHVDAAAAMLAFGRALGAGAFRRHAAHDLFESTGATFEGQDLAPQELVLSRLREVVSASVSKGRVG